MTPPRPQAGRCNHDSALAALFLCRDRTASQQLIKLTVETALNAEMDEHLGYEKHAPQGRGTGNNRNGYSTKRLKGQHGEVTIQAPRDRNSSFEPQFVHKGQSRLTQMDDQILALYAKGLSTRDIVDAFKEMYDADISAGLVSKVSSSRSTNGKIGRWIRSIPSSIWTA